jgi:hypothetical protein
MRKSPKCFPEVTERECEPESAALLPNLGRLCSQGVNYNFREMKGIRITRRVWAWMAVAALIMPAIAPAFWHLTAAAGPDFRGEICFAHESSRLGSDPTQGHPARTTDPPPDHCPYCSIHPDISGVSQAALQAVSAPWQARLEALVVVPPPRSVRSWASAQPRAPPPLA